MSNEIIIDDNDRQFSYKGDWEILKSSTINDRQWRGTAHSTWDFDATASLTFTGVQIQVYGTVPAGRGTSAVDFALDGGNGERVWHTSGSNTLYGVLFYDSGPLSSGSHTIVMSNKGEDNDMDFRLDRVVILPTPIVNVTPPQPTNPVNLPPTSTQPSASASTLTSAAALTNALSSTADLSSTIRPSPGLSSDSSAASAPSRSLTSVLPSDSGLSSLPNQTSPSVPIVNPAQATETIIIAKETSGSTPIIAGSVVGVVAFLAVLGAFLFLCVRRRRFSSRIPDSPEQSTSHILPTSSTSAATAATAATLVSPFTNTIRYSTNNSNTPSRTNFTTKPSPTPHMGRQEFESSALSYVGSVGSREDFSLSESNSPMSFNAMIPEKNTTPFTSSNATNLNNAPSTGNRFEPPPWHWQDLDRPPSYAPIPKSTHESL